MCTIKSIHKPSPLHHDQFCILCECAGRKRWPMLPWGCVWGMRTTTPLQWWAWTASTNQRAALFLPIQQNRHLEWTAPTPTQRPLTSTRTPMQVHARSLVHSRACGFGNGRHQYWYMAAKIVLCYYVHTLHNNN